jgi:hypothetical protein
MVPQLEALDGVCIAFFFTLICPFRHLAFFTGVFSFSFFFFLHYCLFCCSFAAYPATLTEERDRSTRKSEEEISGKVLSYNRRSPYYTYRLS